MHLQQKFLSYARGCLYGMAFIPLIYIDAFFYPFVMPKAFLARTLIALAVVCTALAYMYGASLPWHRLRAWHAWIPGALLVVAVTTSFFGIDFVRSFWSMSDRADGVLGLFVITLFFYLAVLLFNRAHIQTFLTYVGIATGVVALQAVLQFVEVTTGMQIPFVTDAEHGGRLGGTLGNAAFLAGYLGVGGFVALYMAEVTRGRMHILYRSIALLSLLAILLSATRGTLVALFLTTFGYFVFLSIKGKGNVKKVAMVLLASTVIFGGLFVANREALERVPFEPISRLAAISLEDATTSSRLFIWKYMLEKIAERPVLGVGAEHINVLYNEFYDPSQIGEEWFDRSHNGYLDYAVQYGLFGLLLYFGVLALAFMFAWRKFKEHETTGVLLLLLMSVYVLQLIFVFETVSVLIILYLFAAGVYIKDQDKEKKMSSLSPSLRKVLGSGTLALSGIFFVWMVAPPAIANVYLKQGYSYHVADVPRALSYWERGLALHAPGDIEYGYRFYETYLRQVEQAEAGVISPEALKSAYALSYKVLSNNVARYPYDARTMIYLGHIIEARPDGVPVDADFHLSLLTQAQHLSPKRSQAWYMEANMYLHEADRTTSLAEKTALRTRALSVLDAYTDIVPGFSEPYFIRANILFGIGEEEAATRAASEGVRLYKGATSDARRAAAYFLTVEDFISAEQFLRDIVKNTKTDYVMQFDFAKVLFINGKREEAMQVVSHIERMAPEVLLTDPAFMQAFRASM